MHHSDSFLGVVALRSLARQHDTVSTIKNSICNVRNLCSGRSRIVGHRLQHLCGANYRLASHVALRDHHLLRDEDLRCWNFDTKIATSNHDTISLLEYGIEVVYTLLVLNLRNDLNLFACLTEDAADVLDVVSRSNERSKDHINLILDAKLEICNILLGQSWKINICARQVHTLLGGDLSTVERPDANGLIIHNLDDLERLDTIINVDQLACINDLCDILVVHVEVFIVACCSILFVGGNVELETFLDKDIGIAWSIARSDLGALSVESDCDGSTGILALGLAGIVND